jgi:hypothetical protein
VETITRAQIGDLLVGAADRVRRRRRGAAREQPLDFRFGNPVVSAGGLRRANTAAEYPSLEGRVADAEALVSRVMSGGSVKVVLNRITRASAGPQW